MADPLVLSLGKFVTDVRSNGIPDTVQNDASERVIDIMGNALAALDEEPASIALDLVSDMGGAGQATPIGSDNQLPAPNAALVNGTLAHALDFDDTHLPSVLHPSASVVPAALAVAEMTGASGSELLAAVAVGDEIAVRLGMASYDSEIRNSIFFEKGLHATSIIGTLASAAAAAMLLGLDDEEVSHAIGIAASMGAGLLEANRTGGSVKRIHCGWAAHSGITAAMFAKGGLTGPPTVLEGRFGFFRAYSDGRFDTDAILGGLGSQWEMLRIFYKPYPTNHFTHAGIDASLRLLERGVDPSEIDRIELGVPAPVLRTIAEPSDQKARPLTPYHAKFSGPFTVAAALVGGGGLGVYSNDFTPETLRDAERLRLAGLVDCYADDEATEIFPHQFPGVLTVGLRDGSEMTERISVNRGGPDRPLSSDELATKFRLNASQHLPEGQVEELEAALWGLAHASSVSDVLALSH
ncbi:MAG: MmgE/PrpD family protein [Acidimicrobiia bacterium]